MSDAGKAEITLWCVHLDGRQYLESATLTKQADGTYQGTNWRPGIRLTLREERIYVFPGGGADAPWKVNRYGNGFFWTDDAALAAAVRHLAEDFFKAGQEQMLQQVTQNLGKLVKPDR